MATHCVPTPIHRNHAPYSRGGRWDICWVHNWSDRGLVLREKTPADCKSVCFCVWCNSRPRLHCAHYGVERELLLLTAQIAAIISLVVCALVVVAGVMLGQFLEVDQKIMRVFATWSSEKRRFLLGGISFGAFCWRDVWACNIATFNDRRYRSDISAGHSVWASTRPNERK